MATSIKFQLYLITCIVNGKQYVGQTVSPSRRWAHHRHMARSDKSNGCSALHDAMREYGSHRFEMEVIASCLTREDANATEAQLIVDYGTISPAGYNLKAGGRASSHSAATKLKIGAANKGRQTALGRKLSDETKAKIALALKGNRSRLGQLHSAETKAKMSASMREVRRGY